MVMSINELLSSFPNIRAGQSPPLARPMVLLRGKFRQRCQRQLCNPKLTETNGNPATDFKAKGSIDKC